MRVSHSPKMRLGPRPKPRLGLRPRLKTPALLGVACLAWAAPASGGAQLLVISFPPGAEVFLDGKTQGGTPLSLMSVSPGAHELKVVMEGYETWTKKARFRPGPNSYTAVLRKTGAAPAGGAASERTGSATGLRRAEAASAAQAGKGIERSLDSKVSLELVDTPLSEAVTFLQTLTKVNMILDPQAIREKGDTPITLKVTGNALRFALDSMLKLADLDYALKDNAIFISTRERLKGGGGEEEKEKPKKKEDIPRKINVPCPICEGTGEIKEAGCHSCRADGYAGTGLCAGCRGKGRTDFVCPYCGGAGKGVVGGKEIECRACAGKGTAVCRGCKGTGEILRPNPEAASGPTTVCQYCAGSGFEEQLKCRKCTGNGTVTVRDADAVYVYSLKIPCLQCGGDGIGAPACPKCDGMGYKGPTGPKRLVFLCQYCAGTGRLLTPCRTCRGRGWYPQR